MAEVEQGSADRVLGNGRALRLRWAGVSDLGRRRESNQDAFFADASLFVVADGMGGHAGGEMASTVTIAHLRALAESGEVSRTAIEKAIGAATQEIISHPDAAEEGTGTTLTGVCLDAAEGRWLTLNIGDSRVYLVRGEGIAQVTTDHSVVQEMISTGQLSPEEAEGHPYSNIITRAVGASEVLSPDYVSLDVLDGDAFVICSDGLTKELTDYGILHFVRQHDDPAEAVSAMLAAALENGGRDNITLILVRAEAEEGSSSTAEDSVE